MNFNQDTISDLKKDTIKLTGIMSFSGIIGKILSFPSAIVIAKFLGPSLLGILAIIKLIQQYAGYTHLGLLQSLPRDVPIAYGKGDEEEAKTIKNVVFTGLFFSCLVSVIVLWILYGFGINFKGTIDFQILLLLSFLLIVNRANSYLRSYTKAEGKFMIIGRLDLILKLFTPALTIPAVIFLKIKGILLAMLLLEVVSVWYYLLRLKKPEFHFFLSFKKTFTLLKTGFMIFINSISDGIFWSVGLMIIAALMTTESVGFYNIALGAMLIVEPFSQAINMTVYRKIMVDGGKYGTDSPEHFKKYTQGLLVIYIMFTSLILGLFILLYTVVIRTILFEYTESLSIMIILAFGYMVYTSRIFMSFYLNVTNQLFKRLVIIASGLAINTLLSYLSIKLGYGIQGVAAACSLSFLFISFLIVGISFKQIYGNFKYVLPFLSKICLISAVLTGLIFLFNRWVLFDYIQLSTLFSQLLLGTVDLAVKGLIFSISCFGLYFLFFKRYRLYKEIKYVMQYVWYSFINRFQLNKKTVYDA